ncbi:hypothetical protein Ade02nite_09880 [Paractinoplanes deccanensis]|uniref:Lipoprotein n=1 Tax=Paractinoplanes deccanensis TaxID=113561 RepID=A0ABQ3XX78_9ACTN|nr:hypothetical protein [Actinoplanes deccanensis]GID72347.1 hypothetical protein Ade02nite_09880 [Actinoplanes deccanensis]
MRRAMGGLLVLVLGLAGCADPRDGGEQPQVAVSVSLPADPKAALAFAAEKLGEQSARITFTIAGGRPPGTRLAGVVDAATGNYDVTADSYAVRRIGDDVWMKATRMPKMELTLLQEQDLNKWIKLTAFNIETTNTFQPGFPWQLPRGTVEQGSKITRIGDRSFRGVAVRAPRGKDGHFAAEVDQAGRLTRVSSGFGESSDDLYVIEFSDFGLPVTVEPPPADEVIEKYVSTVDAGIF